MRIYASLSTSRIHHNHPGLEGGDDFSWGFTRDDDYELCWDIFEEVEEGIFRFLFSGSTKGFNISKDGYKYVSCWFLIEFFDMFFEYFYLVMFRSFMAPIRAIIVDKVGDSSIFEIIQREYFLFKEIPTYFGSLAF